MPEPIQTNIDDRTVRLFQSVMGESLDSREIMLRLGNPDFFRDLAGEDWEHYIPMVLREQWRSLTWEARVVGYALAEDQAQIYQSGDGLD